MALSGSASPGHVLVKSPAQSAPIARSLGNGGIASRHVRLARSCKKSQGSPSSRDGSVERHALWHWTWPPLRAHASECAREDQAGISRGRDARPLGDEPQAAFARSSCPLTTAGNLMTPSLWVSEMTHVRSDERRNSRAGVATMSRLPLHA